MAENALTKKLGPQPRWAWGAEVVGGLLLFVIIRRRRSSSGLTTTTATATPLSGGTTIPSSSGQATTGSTTSYSTLAQWIQSFLGQAVSAQYPASAALNDATAWINGSCVSAAGFNAIGAFILSAGLPPGFSTPPTLSVCPSTGTNAGNPPPPSAPPPPAAPPPAAPSPSPISSTPPALSTLASNILGNVVSVFREGSGWTYVTDRGYVYNSPGSTYYGGTNDGKIGGPIASHIVSARPINSGPNAGGYTLIASNGDTYNFGPSANLANA